MKNTSDLGDLEELQDLIITLRNRLADVLEISEAIKDCYGEVASEVRIAVEAIDEASGTVESLYKKFCDDSEES